MGDTARRKSKVKSQKPKELYSGLLCHFEWSVYLRRAVVGSVSLDSFLIQNLKSKMELALIIQHLQSYF